MTKRPARYGYCSCGCGGKVKHPKYSKWLPNHDKRGERYAIMHGLKPIPEGNMCECGCGEKAKYGNRFIHGHNQRGYKASGETRKKMREWQIGKEISKEQREKLSSYCGELASNWQGGISKDPYHEDDTVEFRKSIMERDNYECQNPFCSGKDTNKMDTHHINYDKMDNSQNNRITLCSPCHGESNFNRTFWQAVYKEVMIRKGYV